MTSSPKAKPYLSSIKPYKAGKSSYDKDVVPLKLSSNENPYGPSPKAQEAYREIANQLHRYPESSCAAIREKLGELYAINPEHIACGAGSDELIGLLIHAYAGVGDEVLFTEHAFLMYRIYTLAAGATPVTAKETDLRADIDHLLAAVTPHTKICFLANPNNPTGSYIGADDMKRLRDGLPSHVILAIDGAYTECVEVEDYDDGLALAKTHDNVVVMRTFSKLYGLPALRLGWMSAHADIIDSVNRVRSPFNVNAAAQAAGLAALEDQAYITEQKALNTEQRHRLAEECSKLGLRPMPSEGNFVLVDCGDAAKATHIISQLEAQHIYIRDVSAYGLPNYVRISVGTTDENTKLINALTEIMA